MKFLGLFFALALVPLVACQSSMGTKPDGGGGANGGTPDASDPDVSPSPDGKADVQESGDAQVGGDAQDGGDAQGGICCPVDMPSCDCFHTGGFATSLARCDSVCDLDPRPYTTVVDSHGCMVLKFGTPYGPSCLGGNPDGSSDRFETATEAPSDSAPEVPAEAADDASLGN